jgi:hypothetical protein
MQKTAQLQTELLTGREKMYGQQKPEKQGKQSLCPRRNRRGMMT